MNQQQREDTPQVKPRPDQPKVVAEMPGDDEMREQLEQKKLNDGFPGSCGGL